MKLKTLKDMISGIGELDKTVDPFILKQEAIKEIKLLIVEGEKDHSGGLFRFGNRLLGDRNNHREFFVVADYIKWKFNISEEDLK